MSLFLVSLTVETEPILFSRYAYSLEQLGKKNLKDMEEKDGLDSERERDGSIDLLSLLLLPFLLAASRQIAWKRKGTAGCCLCKVESVL
jgi:hypothetical protein